MTFGRSGAQDWARMSKIKNGGLDQYGAGPFEQQQFGAAGVEGVKLIYRVRQYLLVAIADASQ